MYTFCIESKEKAIVIWWEIIKANREIYVFKVNFYGIIMNITRDFFHSANVLKVKG